MHRTVRTPPQFVIDTLQSAVTHPIIYFCRPCNMLNICPLFQVKTMPRLEFTWGSILWLHIEAVNASNKFLCHSFINALTNSIPDMGNKSCNIGEIKKCKFFLSLQSPRLFYKYENIREHSYLIIMFCLFSAIEIFKNKI